MNIEIRSLSKHFINNVLDLVHQSFEPEILMYMTYGQRGIFEFLGDSLPMKGVIPDRDRIIAIDSIAEKVIGFADFSNQDRVSSHLSYICVDEAYRGRNIATSLIHHFLQTNSSVKQLTLDVFSQNVAAIGLYKKLGFLAEQNNVWHVRPIFGRNIDEKIKIFDTPQMNASQLRFGFSILRIQTKYGEFSIGRLGDEIIRMNNRIIFNDDRLLATLRQVFPRIRSAVLITDEDDLYEPPKDSIKKLISTRMCLTLQ